MSNKEGFLDGLKHMVFEDDPEPQKANAPAAAAGAAPAKAPVAVATFAASAAVADSDEVYRRVLARTDFDATEIGATIQKFLAPLANLPMDNALKFKTAVAQASAQTGLTPEKVLAAFDQLEATLEQERSAFAQKAQQFTDREVSGRSQRINEITAQINTLQEELSTLSSELVKAQSKAATAEGQFTAAVERRRNEIAQQKAQYSGLLK